MLLREKVIMECLGLPQGLFLGLVLFNISITDGPTRSRNTPIKVEGSPEIKEISNQRSIRLITRRVH